ncbi:proline dioxygenase [Aquabacterium sp. NJ1]|uniref:2OG-Fe(II) oxygenase n=1 Tax=Aquabacterium sp. NJ1 TaxID=1538295 RepID=UPI00052D2B32|nr:2OG-Fe(II) oxygenase [Aquabacterium sp. NJ1]KGM39159.1 proline dioxygenase [Aquabacterium sp. NJ1]
MTGQLITPDLRRWIIEQAEAGHGADAVLAAMMASGWEEGVALSALEEVMVERVSQAQAGTGRVPDVAAEGVSEVWAHDKSVKILVQMRNPRVVVFGDFLSLQECQELIDLAKPRMTRSQTVVNATGGSEVNEARTSQGMFFGWGENELCARIEARIAALVNWPVENGEGIQILRYAPGAEYKPHFDYFDPSQPGSAAILKRGGQRVGTVVMYLNTPEVGGATTFPDAGIDVHAVAGQAVFFAYGLPHPSTKTLHGGAPVKEGEKWVATKWLRERAFE